MRRTLLPLLLVASAAAARTPAPSPTEGVPDREVLRLLSARYDGPARLQGEWSSRDTPDTHRSVCADSGARRGDRLVAVCSTAADAGTSHVDLFVIEPATAQRGRARIRARFRGIERDPAARDDVRLMALAPNRVGFITDATTAVAGVARTTRSLYAERDDGLRRLLTVGTRYDDRGACPAGDSRTARRCRARSSTLACALRADPSHVDAGAWPLALQVTGLRRGEVVNRVIPISHDAYGYRIAARMLETQGCDGGD